MNAAGQTLFDYLVIFWHRKFYFLAAFVAILAGTLISIQIIPANYRSTATILVEQQEIPEDWVDTSVRSFADERIELILKRVMTEENVLKVIDKLNLVEGAASTGSSEVDMEKDADAKKRMIKRIRSNLRVVKERAEISDPRDRVKQATIAFNVTFSDPDPNTATRVVEEIASLFLEENVKTRSQAASDTRRFLQNELEKIASELVTVEKKIALFKEGNRGSLPEEQELNVRLLQSAETQIVAIEQNIRSMEERRAFLQTSLEMTSRMASTFRNDEDETSLPPEQRLMELEARYKNLRAKYSNSHPDVVRVKRELSEIRTQIAENITSTQSTPAVDPTIVRMKADLDAAAADSQSLKEQKERLNQKVIRLEELIAKAPEVEREYQILVRERENLIRDHDEAQDKISEARLAESLEVEQKGERFTLLESPRTPNRPDDPDPRKLFGLGLILSFFGGFGAIVTVEKIDERVRSPGQMEMVTGLPVLSVVPYIRNQDDKKRTIRVVIVTLLVLTLAGVAAAYLIHNYYKPLDEIEKLQWMSPVWSYLLTQ